MFFSGWLRRSSVSTKSPNRQRSTVRLQCEMLEDRVVPTLVGNQVFPLDNPWNQKITNAPVAANSATLVNSVGLTRGLKADFGPGLWEGKLIGIPYNVVSGNQPKISVIIDAYEDESDVVPVPIPANAVIEGDPASTSQNTGDRHLIVYDKDNNILYELFNVHRPSETADGRWHADSQAVWDLNENSFRPAGWTSADAAGLPILPGLVRPDEVFDAGIIDHAIRFTVSRSANQYIYPASHQAGSANSSYPRMGERFRLKQSFDISGFSPANQVILQAMKDYGLIVSDNGSSWYVSGEPSSRWNQTDLHRLGSVLGSNFEVVDLTPIVSGLSSSSGAAGSTITISGLNYSGGAGMTQVYFGNTLASQFTINSDSSITVQVPAGANGSSVDVKVSSPYGTSTATSAGRFTYGAATPQPGRFQFGAPTYSTNEGVGTFTVTVTRTNGSSGAVSVNYSAAGGSAAAEDYAPVSGTLNFADGQTSRTFTVTIVDDELFEGTESLNLSLSDPTGGATLGSPASATLSIADNDAAPQPGRFEFSASTYSVNESAGSLVVTVTRTNGSSGAVSVDYNLTGISASADDYEPLSGTLNFAAGQTSQTFTINIIDDALAESTESLRLTLSNPTGGATLGSPTTATVSIADDDIPRPGVFELAEASYSIGENGGFLQVTILRTSGSDGIAKVQYTTDGLTARSGKDVLKTSGTLTFAHGETSKTILIPILNDDRVEGDETFRVLLRKPRVATLGAQIEATVTIIDDDFLTAAGVQANTAVNVTLDDSYTAAANWAWVDKLLRKKLRNFIVTWEEPV